MIINTNSMRESLNMSNKNIINNTQSSNKEKSEMKLKDTNAVSLRISNQGYMKQIQSLMRRKELLVDRKNSFMERALEKELDVNIIKEKQEYFDKEIEEIDRLLGELSLNNQKELLNMDKKTKEKNKLTYEKYSDERKEIDQGKQIVSSSINIKELKNMSKVKNSLEGEARVLESEIKLDKIRGINIQNKEEKLQQLNQSIDDIYKSIGEKINEFFDKEAKESNKENDNSKENEKIECKRGCSQLSETYFKGN